MTTEHVAYEVESVGDAAGVVWHFLDERGPVTLSKLAREIDMPRDLVMQGLGWLAREGKIRFERGARSKKVFLT